IIRSIRQLRDLPIIFTTFGSELTTLILKHTTDDMRDNRLTLKWLDYNKYKFQIQALRKSVFIEEQGLDEFVLDSPIDEKGLHLGLFAGDTLVSSVSLFPYHSDDNFVREELGIKSQRPYVIQFSRRV